MQQETDNPHFEFKISGNDDCNIKYVSHSKSTHSGRQRGILKTSALANTSLSKHTEAGKVWEMEWIGEDNSKTLGQRSPLICVTDPDQ